MRVLRHVPLIGTAIVLSFASALYAQRAPAIPGVTGTLVTPQTQEQEGKVANKVAVATEDVLDRSGKGPLSDLIPGTTVVLHYNVDKVTEGIVSTIDGSQITVRFDNGKTEDFQLASKVEMDAGLALKKKPEGATRIVVYTNASGERVARYFKPKS